MNKTPYDDMYIRVLELIEKFIKLKDYLGKFFKKKKYIQKQAIKNEKGKQRAEHIPKGKYGIPNYSYYALEFLNEDAQNLFEDCLKKVPSDKDYSYLDFSNNKIYVRGKKYVIALFDFTDKEFNIFIKSEAILDNWVHIRKLENKLAWKEAPKEQKLLFN